MSTCKLCRLSGENSPAHRAVAQCVREGHCIDYRDFKKWALPLCRQAFLPPARRLIMLLHNWRRRESLKPDWPTCDQLILVAGQWETDLIAGCGGGSKIGGRGENKRGKGEAWGKSPSKFNKHLLILVQFSANLFYRSLMQAYMLTCLHLVHQLNLSFNISLTVYFSWLSILCGSSQLKRCCTVWKYLQCTCNNYYFCRGVSCFADKRCEHFVT